MGNRKYRKLLKIKSKNKINQSSCSTNLSKIKKLISENNSQILSSVSSRAIIRNALSRSKKHEQSEIIKTVLDAKLPIKYKASCLRFMLESKKINRIFFNMVLNGSISSIIKSPDLPTHPDRLLLVPMTVFHGIEMELFEFVIEKAANDKNIENSLIYSLSMDSYSAALLMSLDVNNTSFLSESLVSAIAQSDNKPNEVVTDLLEYVDTICAYYDYPVLTAGAKKKRSDNLSKPASVWMAVEASAKKSIELPTSDNKFSSLINIIKIYTSVYEKYGIPPENVLTSLSYFFDDLIKYNYKKTYSIEFSDCFSDMMTTSSFLSALNDVEKWPELVMFFSSKLNSKKLAHKACFMVETLEPLLTSKFLADNKFIRAELSDTTHYSKSVLDELYGVDYDDKNSSNSKKRII